MSNVIPELALYANDTHLLREQGDLFRYEAALDSYDDRLFDAVEDVLRDLARYGYWTPPSATWTLATIDPKPFDDSASATVELSFTAAATGDLTVPAGTRIGTLNPSGVEVTLGDTVFATSAELVVTAGNTGTVAATAEMPGRTFNVRAGKLTYQLGTALANLASVTNAAAATGGADHQLCRLVVYRALELIYSDLFRLDGDGFHNRMELYRRKYDDELRRMQSAGIQVDHDGDGTEDDEERDERHGYAVIRRG